MATEVIIPKVDMVMETGTFVEWLRQEGQAVVKGEPLFVILTDKAAIEVEAPESGILAGLKANPDDVIPVTTVIGYILQPDESTPSGSPPALAVRRGLVNMVSESGLVQHATPAHETLPAARRAPGEIRATPLARSLARELMVDLAQVTGSGPRGRIYRADIERQLQDVPASLPANQGIPKAVVRMQPDSPLPQASPRELRRVALKGPRAIIAQRLVESVATIPHIHITIQVDMSEATRLRAMTNPVYQRQNGHGVSYTAIIALAVARTLQKHPLLNSSLSGEEIVLWQDVHLGIATDLGDNLVVPVLHRAQEKKLEEISREAHSLVEKARNKKLPPGDMTGSTFTISNLGMLGAVSFTAIINPPEAAILAVGKIVDTPVAVEGAAAIRPLMNLTLAVDHRIVNGAEAARFLSDLKHALENPYLLV